MSFSVPRCSRPICGSTRATTSPSSSSTRRSTPCAAGCCGPKLMVKLRSAGSFMSLVDRRYSLPAILLVARQRIIGTLPWREEVEFAELLVEAHGLVKHALLLVVVSHLDKAGQREILAQRMPLETVVGQDAPHVGVTGKEHAIEVIDLALEPIGAGKHVDDRRHLRILVCLHAQPNTCVQRRREEVIDHVETLLASGIVDRGHVGDVDKAASGVVAQEFHDIYRSFRRDRQGELIEGDRMPRYRAWKRAGDRLPQSVEPAVVHK